MTEQHIRQLAERYGLTVTKRIETGSETQHFAAFELRGAVSRVHDAWELMKVESRGLHFDRVRTIADKSHPDFDKPFIELKAVWCEPTLED